ncbi:hypothetical protein [Pseudomonas nitroreducens]|uniref:hypothetical protein n=1 Tax=Pseudomonas nitroreducens TaxID=46680 RepID=UPI002D7F500D|nr:hypothetical protein [Pseudomonas nitroreducens]
MSTQIKEWLTSASEEERKRVAGAAATSVAYLYQLAGGHRLASLGLANRLCEATGGLLTIEGIRPDLHRLISSRSTIPN